eukprot:2747958-Rhodomonas_salina.1
MLRSASCQHEPESHAPMPDQSVSPSSFNDSDTARTQTCADTTAQTTGVDTDAHPFHACDHPLYPPAPPVPDTQPGAKDLPSSRALKMNAN